MKKQRVFYYLLTTSADRPRRSSHRPAQTVFGRGWADLDPYKDTENGMTILDEIALEEGI